MVLRPLPAGVARGRAHARPFVRLWLRPLGPYAVAPEGLLPLLRKIEFVPRAAHRDLRRGRLEKARIRLFARQILLGEGARDILRLGAEGRAVAQEIIGAFRPRIERRARHGKDFPSRFGCEFRGDQRAGPARRLDDDNRPAKARDNPVAAGEVAPPRFPAERHFADRHALFKDWVQARLHVRRGKYSPNRPRGPRSFRSRSLPDAPVRQFRVRGRRR